MVEEEEEEEMATVSWRQAQWVHFSGQTLQGGVSMEQSYENGTHGWCTHVHVYVSIRERGRGVGGCKLFATFRLTARRFAVLLQALCSGYWQGYGLDIQEYGVRFPLGSRDVPLLRSAETQQECNSLDRDDRSVFAWKLFSWGSEIFVFMALTVGSVTCTFYKRTCMT
jgi:hypothetical protein